MSINKFSFTEVYVRVKEVISAFHKLRLFNNDKVLSDTILLN